MPNYYRVTRFEAAASWVHGFSGSREDLRVAPLRATTRPREALERAVLPALSRAPCFVAFSGGRDSSAVLAVTTAVARSHGLPEPVPFTERYPDLPESDEAEWQQMVLRHLGLTEWLRVDRTGENDLLGEAARSSLVHRGLLWPAPLHIKVNQFSQMAGGSLLTGEGGDEVLGPVRVSALRRTARLAPRPSRVHALNAAAAVAPAPLRRWRNRRALHRGPLQPWLRSAIRTTHLSMLADDLATEPLRASQSLPWLLRRRASVVASQNYRLLAAEFGVNLVQPLLDPEFVDALAIAAGPLGFASRTEAMRRLAGDLLPEAVLARATKAYFNRAFLGESTREFARAWDGSTLDLDLVDPELLRQEWLSKFPSATSGLLLQAAWLAGAVGDNA